VIFCIDQVKDLIPSTLLLFSHLSNEPHAFAFAGDTAQTIGKGCEFRYGVAYI
jgi:hypothetical protein